MTSFPLKLTTIAVSVLATSLPLSLAGCPTQRTAELTELRRQVAALEKTTGELRANLSERQAAAQEQLARHREAWMASFSRLETLLEQQRAVLTAHVENGLEHVEKNGTRSHVRPEGFAVRSSRKSNDVPDEQTAEGQAVPQEDDASERVRALMADVAARLQVATEKAGEDRKVALQLTKARQILVEADRAAAQKDYPRAEKLAQDAAEVIASVATGEVSAGP